MVYVRCRTYNERTTDKAMGMVALRLLKQRKLISPLTSLFDIEQSVAVKSINLCNDMP